jgi:hypothetical protein
LAQIALVQDDARTPIARSAAGVDCIDIGSAGMQDFGRRQSVICAGKAERGLAAIVPCVGVRPVVEKGDDAPDIFGNHSLDHFVSKRIWGHVNVR